MKIKIGGSQRSLATNTAARRHGIELPGARQNSSTARACGGSAGIKRGGSGCHLDAGGVERERARRRDSQVARRENDLRLTRWGWSSSSGKQHCGARQRFVGRADGGSTRSRARALSNMRHGWCRGKQKPKESSQQG